TAHTETLWDDVLFDHKVFHAVAHLIPAIFIYATAGYGSEDLVSLPEIIKGIAKFYILLAMTLGLVRFLDASQDIYNTYPFAQERPIKGYIQLVKILIYFIAGIILISILVNQDPGKLFAGLGAMAAVLMFVFKDPILGFVASIQLAANKMVKPGDWITVPKFGVDGTVVDISLTTVKIQNWDKTITSLPTYSLVSESVTNWIGMQESGGRRIQRSIFLDMTCIKFCDTQFLDKIAHLPIIQQYDALKKAENPDNPRWIEQVDPQPTNLSLFRSYVEAFLWTNPKTHNDMALIVRFLQSTERGLPLEYIVFSKEQQSEKFESTQAEIVDHLLAVISEFDLKVFQNPSGGDFRAILKNE
ncbi:MAG: mechanosensitive ion channel family protein, partial [Marinilabiliales bacterium]|nr:mechanosensitive ion channel family protein [Marinilabiliales bacterium]